MNDKHRTANEILKRNRRLLVRECVLKNKTIIDGGVTHFLIVGGW